MFEKNIEVGSINSLPGKASIYSVKIFQEYLKSTATLVGTLEWLYDVYRAKGDYDTMITLSESALANNQFEQNRHSLLYYLYTASKQKGEYVTALATFRSVQTDCRVRNYRFF